MVYEFRKKRIVEPVAPPEVFDTENDEEMIGGGGGGGGEFESAQRKRSGVGIGGPVAPTKPTTKKAIKRKYPFGISENDPHDDNMTISDDDLDDDDIDDIDDL